MKFYLPFKYKLTVIIAVIIMVLLTVIFSVVQQELEQRFRSIIDKQLVQAKDYVSQRMDDRFDLLYNDATTIVGDKLIRDVILDRTLSELTSNDIVTNEVLPSFENLQMLAVTDGNGELLAKQDHYAEITESFIASEWFTYALEGEVVGGYIYTQLQSGEQGFYQGVAMPVFLGEAMIGIVLVARDFGQADVKAIKRISEIDIAVLGDGKRRVSTAFSGISDSKNLLDGFDLWLERHPESQQSTVEVLLGDERFLLQWVVDETGFVPPYIIVRSLDESLLFVTNLRQTMMAIGSIGIVLALVVAFVFAVSISSPIKLLTAATHEVARENFGHQVIIHSQDEFSQLGDSFNQMIIDLAEKQKIRAAFDKSVSKEVADHMLEQGAKLGGSREFATILFADIRGFTSLSESMDERSLINLLNQYFSQVNGCITQQNGVIDKFIGDAVMALFGTPIPSELSAYSAMIAAKDMLETVDRFNEQCRLIFGCELHIGIGLNSGYVVAGMVGAENRLNFTVLGDQVNIASRIEGLCKNYGITLILSESSVEQVRQSEQHWHEPIVFRQLDCVQVKGKTKGLRIFEPFFNPMPDVVNKIRQFETGLNELLLGNIDSALSQLTQLQQDWPDDEPTQRLYRACLLYGEQPKQYQRDYNKGVRIETKK